MIERTRWGQTYHVGSRQQTPHFEVENTMCEDCGREKSNCGLADCERHYHNVVVR